MSNLKFNPRPLLLVLFMVVIVALRVLAPLSPEFNKIANFTVVGAVALFGGAYFKNNLTAFGFPLILLLVSDVILSTTIYRSSSFLYEGWYWVYIAFALMVLVGKVVLRKVNAGRFIMATAATVVIHWIITDIGVWYGSSLYSQDLLGFWECLVAAIPFERSFLYGTLIYGSIMFGSFEFLQAKYPSLRFNKPVAA
ncbi:MAG: hypothetical protein EOP47_29585 [Sphingobacteriaceae bacterium]|nr:MAG: hypothetical protein EOP47_29585 [Sphingobacteriaceae bacterium]